MIVRARCLGQSSWNLTKEAEEDWTNFYDNYVHARQLIIHYPYAADVDIALRLESELLRKLFLARAHIQYT
jgi:hypothetical protein